MCLFTCAPGFCNRKRQVQWQLPLSQTSGIATPPPPAFNPSGGGGVSISIRLISNHLHIQPLDPGPNPDKLNKQFSSMQTPGCKGAGGGEVRSRTKHKLLHSNMNVYLLNLLSILFFFLSLPSSSFLGVIYAAGTELCTGLRGAD